MFRDLVMQYLDYVKNTLERGEVPESKETNFVTIKVLGKTITFKAKMFLSDGAQKRMGVDVYDRFVHMVFIDDKGKEYETTSMCIGRLTLYPDNEMIMAATSDPNSGVEEVIYKNLELQLQFTLIMQK